MKNVYIETAEELAAALRSGQIIKEVHGEAEYGMVAGTICRRARGHKWSVFNTAITFVGKSLYFEDDRVQLEVGKIYLTRNSKRVFILDKQPLYYCGGLEHYTDSYICYDQYGQVVDSDGKREKCVCYPEDIIREVEK